MAFYNVTQIGMHFFKTCKWLSICTNAHKKKRLLMNTCTLIRNICYLVLGASLSANIGGDKF